jgi:purine-binding chemotaxis protein CheW
MTERPAIPLLVFRFGGRMGAVPAELACETMRPLPVEGVPAAPSFVSGLALIRGVPTPVVDLAALVGSPGPVAGSRGAVERAEPGRFVTVRAGGRRVALAVDSVVGITTLPGDQVAELPAVLAEAASRGVTAVGALDGELLAVLDSARLVPEAVWRAVAGEAGV